MSDSDDMKNAIINGDIDKVKEEYDIHSRKGFFCSYCCGEFMYEWQFKFESYDRQENRTPLMVALEAKQFEMAKFFLENGVNINKGILYYDFNRGSYPIREESPLYIFCKKGQFEIVKFLLENGADANSGIIHYRIRIIDGLSRWDYNDYNGGESPLEIAWYQNQKYIDKNTYLAIIEILVEYGAKVNIDECKNSPIMTHIKQVSLLSNVKSGDLEKIRQCLANGFDVNFIYAFGKTALMWACQKGNFEVALMLISAGADINAKDTNGKTVLNYAADGGNAEIMKLLLAQGADTGAKK